MIISFQLFLCIFWNLFIYFSFQQSFLLWCQLSHSSASICLYPAIFCFFQVQQFSLLHYLNITGY